MSLPSVRTRLPRPARQAPCACNAQDHIASTGLSGSCPCSTPSPIRSSPRDFRCGFDPCPEVIPAIVMDPVVGLVANGKRI